MYASCEQVCKPHRLAELRRLHGRQADPMAGYWGCWDRSARVTIACAIRAHSRYPIYKAVHRMLCFLNLDWVEQSQPEVNPSFTQSQLTSCSTQSPILLNCPNYPDPTSDRSLRITWMTTSLGPTAAQTSAARANMLPCGQKTLTLPPR